MEDRGNTGLEDLSIYSVARANTPQHEHEGAGLLCLLSPPFLLFLFFSSLVLDTRPCPRPVKAQGAAP